MALRKCSRAENPARISSISKQLHSFRSYLSSPDAKAIADHLISRKTVVLNLETASPENRRRIIDFLVGVSYAISGSLKPVANLTYIITPYNVGFIGDDLAAELENNGVII